MNLCSVLEFRPSKLFKYATNADTAYSSISANEPYVQNIHFDDRGENCIVSTSKDSLLHYNIREGCLERTVFSKKYGVDCVRFTRDSNQVVYASTKGEGSEVAKNSLRLLSVHNNQFVRYFQGHNQKVVDVKVSSKEFQIISSALDHTVRLWDYRSNNCQGLVNFDDVAHVAFDPQALVYLVVTSKDIALYDLRNYEKGALLLKKTSDVFVKSLDCTSVQFSNDNKYILVATKQKIYILDSYTLEKIHCLTLDGPSDHDFFEREPTFTPDSSCVIAGASDGKIRFYDVSTGRLQRELIGLEKSVLNTRYNPQYHMMVSGKQDIAFWLPTDESLTGFL